MVKLLFLDVDGTLTDGKIYLSSSGEEMKAFCVKDGYGISRVLPQYEITPVIITARRSRLLEIRTEELGIQELYQGIGDKLSIMRQVASQYYCDMSETAYIGDDIPDLPCLESAGYSGCPSDAVDAVKQVCTYQCVHEGGRGAVREFIEWLVREQ